MEQQFLNQSSNNVHPRRAAELFGVHHRTVFRWVSRGLLTSKNAFLNSEELRTRYFDWERSCTKSEAQKKLDISAHTLADWVRRGVLVSVQVLGFTRIVTTSVDEALQRIQEGTFSLHLGYVPVYKLHLILGIRYDVLLSHIKKRKIKSKVFDGKTMIPLEEYYAIKAQLDSTLKYSDVKRILKRDKGTIQRWTRKGRLREVNVYGLRRIETSSIATNNAERFQLELYLGLARRKRIVQFRFNVQRVPELGRLKVVSCRQAGKLLGKSEDFVEELFDKGILRGGRVRDRLFISASSLEVYILKMKKGKK